MNHQHFNSLCSLFIQYLNENPGNLYLGNKKKAQPLPQIEKKAVVIPKKLKKPPEPIQKKKAPKKETQEVKKSPFQLKPIVKKSQETLASLKESISKACPFLKVISELPSDTEGKKERYRWKEAVILPQFPLLYEKEQEQHLPFLTNICQAITKHQFTSRPIEITDWEKQHRWEEALSRGNVCAIIAPDILIYTHKTLSTMIKKERHALFIGEVPLITLTSIQSYKESPPLKKSLWTAIVQQMQNRSKS